MKTYEETLSWIHSRKKFGSRPGLTRVNALLSKLGNPQNKVKSVHISGTNGKGSTVTFLRCLLEKQALQVGTFTSPYVEIFNERISINGIPISNDDLISWSNKIRPLVDEMDCQEATNGITEFEILTALMFDYFAEKKVDIMIIEVGIGGLLDSTNVITPIISGIVTVGLDHMDILGNSLAKIAYQKAGIIKEKVPVVIGDVDDEAREVIIKEASKKNSPVYIQQQAFESQHMQTLRTWGERFSFKNEVWPKETYQIPMLGQHQVDNASVALQLFCIISQLLQLHSSKKERQEALNQAFWPGRMEKISEEPLIVLDGAHNEPAIKCLVNNLKKEFKGQKINTIFAGLKTKNLNNMLSELATVPDIHVVLSTFDYPNAANQSNYETLPLEKQFVYYQDWRQALHDFLQQESGEEIILITGSLYFISEVKKEIRGLQEAHDE